MATSEPKEMALPAWVSAFFILPGGEFGDAVKSMQIGGADGKPTINISADHVLELIAKNKDMAVQIATLTKSLAAEQARIRRLMAALCDELF